MESNKKVTPAFNIFLILVLAVVAFLQVLNEPAKAEETLFDLIFGEQSLWSMLTFSIVSIAAVVFLTAFAFKEFWNRFVTDVFDFREIQFSEALSLILAVAIISGPN
jgi:uncharacterized membrane protein YuzA (DUF378 family)